MDKKILSEINRSREIMGLGGLIREAVSGEAVKIWLQSDGKDAGGNLGNYIQKLVDNFVKKGYVQTTIDGEDIWTALNTAFYNITGDNIVDENGEGTNAAFGGKGQFWNVPVDLYHTSAPRNRPLIKLGDNKLRVNSSELGLSSDNPVDITALIDAINTYNVDNAGTEQLTYPSMKKAYELNGNANSIKSEKVDNMLYLWSIKKSKSVRTVTDDETIPGEVIAGDVLKADLGDSFEDLEIKIKDTSEINDIKSKMEAILNKGGEITSVTIASTASNTGLKDGGKAEFATMMTDAGFKAYANLDNKKGVEGDFTIDEVNTTDRALAVARGKLLAKELGVEDKAVFKFSITNAKTVNLTVQGSSPDTKEDDITISGSIDDKIVTKDKGKMSSVFPNIQKIKIVKRGLISRIGDKIGTSKGAIKKKLA